MKASIRIGGRTREVALERRGEAVLAQVDGREYRLSIREPERGVYSILPVDEGGRSVEAFVHEAGGLFRVRMRDRSFEASLERPGRQGAAPPSATAGGRHVLKAVMPGKVVRVLVEAGAAVRRGQGIVVVEAMKMENAVASPRDGVIEEVLVSPGDRVEAGAALAVIE